MNRSRSILCAALMASACSSGSEPRTPSSVELDRQAVTLEVGETVLIQATFLDQHGSAFAAPPPNVALSWSSSNGVVATVNQGTIIAAGAGTATVTASAPGIPPATVQVTVTARSYQGQISLDYSGTPGGHFSINSTFQLGPMGATTPDWAVSFYDPSFASQDVVGFSERTDGKLDVVWFWATGAPITAPATRVISGFLILGLDADETWERGIEFPDGTATFTVPSQGRLSGTFSSQAVDVDTNEPVSISAGTFDVPVLPMTALFPGANASVTMSARVRPQIPTLRPPTP
jgi:hypothetical protein